MDLMLLHEPPDSHHYQAAMGWLELDNHLQANEELEQISPLNLAHLDVLELRLTHWLTKRVENATTQGVGISKIAMEGCVSRAKEWLARFVEDNQ